MIQWIISPTSGTQKPTAEQVVKDIRRKTRKQHSSEESERASERHAFERGREPALCWKVCVARKV